MATPFNFDVGGTIAQQSQGMDALGDLGEFMLRKRQGAAQLGLQRQQEARLKSQQDYQRQQEEAARKRMEARNAALSGALFKDVETPVYQDEEYVDGTAQAPDLSSFMLGMGGQNLSARTLDGAQAPAQEKPWISPELQALAGAGNGADVVSPYLAEAMTGQKEPEPMRWELPKSPTDVISRRRVQTGTKAERVPNENWMADGARAVAGVDPELAMDLAKSGAALAPKTGAELDDVRSLLNSARGKQSQLIAQGAQSDDPQMLALDGEISGYLEELRTSENPNVRNALNRTAQPAAPKDEGAINTATTEANALIDAAKDANNDGVVDDFSKLDRELGSIALKYGINQNDKDWQNVKTYLQSKKDEVKSRYDAMVDKNERARQNARAEKGEARAKAAGELSQDEKFKAMWNANQRLKSTPGDVTAKRSTMNLALRDETGAVIGADEFDGLMSTVLPADKYAQFKSETQSLKADLMGLANDGLRESYLKRIGEKYLGSVDADKLYTYMDDKIPDGYYKRAKATDTEKKAGAPAAGAGNGKAGRVKVPIDDSADF